MGEVIFVFVSILVMFMLLAILAVILYKRWIVIIKDKSKNAFTIPEIVGGTISFGLLLASALQIFARFCVNVF